MSWQHFQLLREIRREQYPARRDSRSANELIVLPSREVQRLTVKIDRGIAERSDELELAIKAETSGRVAYSETRVETRLGEEIEELRRRIDDLEGQARPRVERRREPQGRACPPAPAVLHPGA